MKKAMKADGTSTPGPNAAVPKAKMKIITHPKPIPKHLTLIAYESGETPSCSNDVELVTWLVALDQYHKI